MHDLKATIHSLNDLSVAYARRASSNGPDHDDNAYLLDQGFRFAAAAQLLEDACQASKERTETL